VSKFLSKIVPVLDLQRSWTGKNWFLILKKIKFRCFHLHMSAALVAEPKPVHQKWPAPAPQQCEAVLRIWIRIRPDPYDFAESGSVWAIPDPDLDLDPAVVLLFGVLLLVVLLLVALLGTGDDSFSPLKTWYRGVSYDRDRYPDFYGPSWVTYIIKY